MRHHKWIFGFSGLLLVITIASSISDAWFGTLWLPKIADIALVATLCTLILYTYYTYLIARDMVTPSASCLLYNLMDTPYDIRVRLTNHSRMSIDSRVRITPFLNDSEVRPPYPFYSGETIKQLAPLHAFDGHFLITDLLEREKIDIPKINQIGHNNNVPCKLQFKVDFEYNPSSLSQKNAEKNPRLHYEYDFVRRQLVAIEPWAA